MKTEIKTESKAENRKTLNIKESTKEKLTQICINSGLKCSYDEMLNVLIIFYSVNSEFVDTKLNKIGYDGL